MSSSLLSSIFGGGGSTGAKKKKRNAVVKDESSGGGFLNSLFSGSAKLETLEEKKKVSARAKEDTNDVDPSASTPAEPKVEVKDGPKKKKRKPKKSEEAIAAAAAAAAATAAAAVAAVHIGAGEHRQPALLSCRLSVRVQRCRQT